jgi:hypothetical protein
MTAPERFAEKSDSLLHRGRRPYMTHSVISAGSFAVAHNDFGEMTPRSPNAYPIFRIRASVYLDVGVIDDLLP